MTQVSKDKVFVYIMAGGQGKRFAPISTPEKPKQFLKIINDKPLIKQTYDRVHSLTHNILVGTHVKYSGLVHGALPSFNPQHLLLETESKNTAPSIGHAVKVVESLAGQSAVIVCMPSDHYIEDNDKFVEALNKAVELAYKYKFIITLGMTPTFPATDYGYIKRDVKFTDSGDFTFYRVNTFVEKPNLLKAGHYIQEGSYSWNSGVFVANVETMLHMFRVFAPEIYRYLPVADPRYKYGSTYAEAYYSVCPSISFDYAVMEKTKDILVAPIEVGWTDIGTWDSLERFIKKNKTKQIQISGEFLDYLKENKK